MRARPFIKWAGGKRQILKHLTGSLVKFKDYHEPFLGGGSLFFELHNRNLVSRAYLYDYNSDLINTYNVIKSNVTELIVELKKPVYKNEKEAYYDIRSLEVEEAINKAARFIYLNKTAYNGLYRVNSKGKFNTPFGKYNKMKLFDQETLIMDNKALQKAELFASDFTEVLKHARKDDLIYFDPPYQPLSRTSNFTGYTNKSFGENDQIRLAETFKTLVNRRCHVMLSNSKTKLISELYSNFNIEEVYANRAINSKGNGRGKIAELIVRSWKNKQVPLFRVQKQVVSEIKQ